MRISLTKSTENDTPSESDTSSKIEIDVKVSADDDSKAELVHSHTFDLQPLKKNQEVAIEIFSTKPQLKQIRDYGKRLSQALFSGSKSKGVWEQLKELLPNGRILLELNGDEDLDIIPWEYAWTGSTYLVYQCIFIRIHKPKELHLPKLPLRIVVVTPDPIIPPDDPDAVGLPDLHLNDQFHNFIDGHYQNEKEVILERVIPPTVDRMNEVLLNQSDAATALHFMGHCGEKDVERTLIFEHKDTGKPDFAETRRFSNMPKNLRLAFLCACNTRNVALALVKSGVTYTIGSHCSIPDNIARKFESNFYQLLAGGCSIDSAMFMARVSLMDSTNPGQHDYFSGAMMLYSSTFLSDDGAFENKQGKLKLKLHMPRHNLEVIPTASTFYGRKKELFELSTVLRRMVNRSEQSCRVFTITGAGSKGKSALAVEAMTRWAHLFPGGIFAWPFDSKATSLAQYLSGLVDIFPDDIQKKLREKISDNLGADVIKQFTSYPTSLLILDHANTLKDAEAREDEDAIALGKWLRHIASASDVHVKILVTSDIPLEWPQEQTLNLDALADFGATSMGQRVTIAENKSIDIDSKIMPTRTVTTVHPVHPANRRIYGIPAENHAFVNRPNIMAKIEAALSSNSSSKGSKILALKGLGGMGKSQLMLRFSYLRRDTYDSIFWLKVDSWTVAMDSFRNLAIHLGMDEKSTQGKDSEDKIIEWVRSWLEERINWLLLLDNADEDDMDKKIFKLLPQTGGHIIITTRVNISESNATVIPVDKMQQDEAIFLLLGISSMKQESEKLPRAQEIVTLLDCTPLAVNLARSYISSSGIGLQQYLSKLKTKHSILFRYRDEATSDEYRFTIETVWQLSLERVRAQNPIAAQILQACTFLRPENIPTRLFLQQSSILELTSTSSTSPTSEQDEFIEEALRVLIKYSFLTRTCVDNIGENDLATDLLTMHRLVQRVVYDAMTDEQKLNWVHKIVAALKSETYFSRADSYALKARNIMNAYLPHIHYLVALFTELDLKLVASDKLEKLLTRGVDYLIKYEIYSGVEELARLSIRVLELLPGSDQRRIMATLNNLAVVYENQGKYKEAEPLHQRALKICEEQFGPEHPGTALSLNNLALLYKIQGEFDKAEPLYERALAIREKLGGGEDSFTARALNNLALLYSSQGKYNKAKGLHERALAIREKVLVEEHPETAESVNNLAGVYNDQGRFAECEPLYKRVLAIREKTLGPENASTAMALNNLGRLYRSQGKYIEAEPLLLRTLEICEKALGPEHRDTAVSLNSLADLYESQGKYDEAQVKHKRALEIREKGLGPKHPLTAKSLNGLAVVYKIQGKYNQAELLHQRALKIREEALGLEHPDTADSLSNLATLYDSQGKYTDAEELQKRALKIYEDAFGTEHPATAESLNNLAIIYSNQGKYTEAEELQKRALTIREKLLGKEHPATAESLNNLAIIYSNQGMNEKDEPLYQQALEIREKVLDLNHPDTATSLDNLALLYISQSKLEKAEPMCNQALDIREKALGSEHPDVATSLNTLAQLYQKQGKVVQSKTSYERALAIREKVLGLKHPKTVASQRNLATFSKSQETSDKELDKEHIVEKNFGKNVEKNVEKNAKKVGKRVEKKQSRSREAPPTPKMSKFACCRIS